MTSFLNSLQSQAFEEIHVLELNSMWLWVESSAFCKLVTIPDDDRQAFIEDAVTTHPDAAILLYDLNPWFSRHDSDAGLMQGRTPLIDDLLREEFYQNPKWYLNEPYSYLHHTRKYIPLGEKAVEAIITALEYLASSEMLLEQAQLGVDLDELTSQIADAEGLFIREVDANE